MASAALLVSGSGTQTAEVAVIIYIIIYAIQLVHQSGPRCVDLSGHLFSFYYDVHNYKPDY